MTMIRRSWLSAAAVAALLLVSAPAAQAQSADVQRSFRAFLDRDIRPAARAQGVPDSVLDDALGGLTPDMSLPDLVKPGDDGAVAEFNAQAEFKSPAAYMSEKALAGTAARGRALLAEHRAVLARIEAAYGVPAPIVVAIWGRESAFGTADIRHDAFRVLATKAHLSRRKAMFREELLAALRIAAEGHLPASKMRSSWAGALGQPQFMPTKYLQLAVDFDGDGRKDIWDSVPDALASIANYLRQSGWQPGRDWGFEATIPAGLSCATEGPDVSRTIRQLVSAGAARVSGRPFPERELAGTGHVLMPAGRFGPAFVATPNFYVIKAYNNSDLYALFVGHLADRMAGAKPFRAPWQTPPGGAMTRGDVYRMQQRLVALGYDVGSVDGLAGFKTRRSIGAFEAKSGRPETCWPTPALARSLG
ncbi:lytic murein transglycosylase [Jeongeupella avenae]|uniref:Lytic murein transglycosylase n=2 Tax=Antarcticirhabdus aurantiaca TaxID=2606717 RepID=A0ACD4NTE2_9HYPH|nr:lytic murein transglycosylase [Antarcticirhabdus aurantiaca]WAJ30151.1 lytic murein transglycosylase [Jeongeuplla avenae]